MTAPVRRRVLLALSGGVDSAVCAHLLRQQGYDVEGLYIVFSPAHEAGLRAAQRAAEELGIPLHTARPEALFEEQVVAPFCRAYAGGLTPNPCVVCNPLVKFNTLAATADGLGITKIASGHYARLRSENGVHRICRAASARRDQSYMLYRLPQAILARLLLPLGRLEKPAIRALARSLGLSAAEAPDSQEICFIPGGDYPAYIERRGQTGRPGRFIGPDGQDLGPHRGVHHYTVGQRKRLGVALGRPVCVRAIEPGGDIRLAWPEDALVPTVSLADLVFAAGRPPESGAPCLVKIRSMAAPVPCTTAPGPGGRLLVHFQDAQRAPAPGQHAVLYREDCVLGGGVIQPEPDLATTRHNHPTGGPL